MQAFLFLFVFFFLSLHSMKYMLPIILVAGVMMLGACKEKKKSEDIITTKYVPKHPQAPIAMAEEHLSDTVKWLGSDYCVTVDRTSSDSLKMLTDEIGQEYKDNIITLKIVRKDKSVYFEKTFTRNSFTAYLSGDYTKNSLLSSIRFNEVDKDELIFSVIISHPDALDDEYLSLKLKVNADKGYKVEIDNDLMDELDDESEDEDLQDVD